MSHALTVPECKAALRQSYVLLRARPFRWLLVTIVFLVVVESLMFIPYVGFIVKLVVASLLGAQFMRMCADVEAGGPARPRTFLGAFSLPFPAQWVLVVGGLAPFLFGILYLAAAAGGWQGIEYFFGHMSKADAPSVEHFFVFKMAMNLVGAVVGLIPAAIVLGGKSGVDALVVGIGAALRNWRVLLFFIAINAAFEGLQASLAAMHLPLAILVVVGITSLIVFLVWTITLTYAFARRALDVESKHAVAQYRVADTAPT